MIGERKGFLKYTTKPSNLTGELVRRKISKLKCRQWTNGQLYNSSIKGEGEKKKKKKKLFLYLFFFFINAAQCRVWIFFPQKWSKLFKKNFFSFFRRIIIQRFFFFLRNWTSSLCCIFFFFYTFFGWSILWPSFRYTICQDRSVGLQCEFKCDMVIREVAEIYIHLCYVNVRHKRPTDIERTFFFM